MRWVRAWVLGVAVAAASAAVATVVRGPVLHACSVLASASSSGDQAADLTALLVGCCALVLSVAWSWVVLALCVCTGDVLRTGERAVAAPSLLRPRLVRALVASTVGVSVLGAPAAHAHPAAATNEASPADRAALAPPRPVMELTVLRGLPAPDRVTGRMTNHVTRWAAAAAGEATEGEAAAGGRDHRAGRVDTAGRRVPPTVEVAPGDSLWSLTAGLLPSAASEDVVAAGWPLLYAANRDVVGNDPNLLHPGQTLRISPALAGLVRESRAHARPHLRNAGGHP